MNIQITQTLDLKGLSCPMPIVKTAAAMKRVEPGQVIEVLATDPGSVADFEAWAKATGNHLIELDTSGGVYRFVIEKR